MKILASSIAMLAVVCFTPLLHAQDDAAKRSAAAEELLKTMHTDELFAKQMENMKKMMASFLPKNLPPETLKRAQEAQSVAFDTVFKQYTWETMKADIVQAYSEVFTEQELNDITAFYKTPAGQKFIEKMPQLQAKTMEIMQKRMVTLMPAMQGRGERRHAEGELRR